MESKLTVEMLPQPDDSSCGPTCLQALYRYYGDERPLREVISEIESLEDGGTLAVSLGCHALACGYTATIFTYNLKVFDPTWFADGVDLAAKLSQQVGVKPTRRKLAMATRAYRQFLQEGGRLRFEDLTAALIRRHLIRGKPILTGLSATYLYRSAREVPVDDSSMAFDDVRGEPQGHFVLLCGYDRAHRTVLVADPWGPSERPEARHYWVGIDRLCNAILLGVLTYDANLLLVEPKAFEGVRNARAARRQ